MMSTTKAEIKNQTPLLAAIATLSAIGAGISIYQTRMYYFTRSGMGDMHPICNINATFDCTTVEMSRFADIIPGVPLAGFAIAGYLLILILTLFGFSDSLKTNLRKYIIGFSAIAVLFSTFYFIVMLGIIGKWCLFCLFVDAINFTLLILAFRLARPAIPKPTGGPKLTHIISAGAASLVIAFLITKGINPLAQVKQEDLNDMVESVMNSPSLPITIPPDSPFVGRADAPITIVKFSDYQCPSCKMGALAIHPLFKKYENQVKFVFVNYPLDQACNPEVTHKMHPFACEAAAVAICAAAQNKFLGAYETLFDQQDKFVTGKIVEMVSTIPGINMDQMKSCVGQTSTLEKIRSDVVLGKQMSISATPTFFMNGKKIEGGLPTSLWIEVIDKMLKK